MSLPYYLDAREDRIAINCGNTNVFADGNLVVNRPPYCFTWHGPALRCPRITPVHDRRCPALHRFRSYSSICAVRAPHHHPTARGLPVPAAALRQQVVAEPAGLRCPRCVLAPR